MSPDFRFHVASLVAVFLALGIGILIGTAFVGAPVVERNTRLISRIGTEVAELRREAQEALRNEEALRTLAPALVAGRLVGRHVLVVRTGDYPEAAEQAEEALLRAGARVSSIALPDDAWARRAALEGGEGGELPPPNLLLTRTGGGETTDAARVSAGAHRIALLLAQGRGAAALESFHEEGLVAGELPEGPSRLIVLVGGSVARPPDPPGGDHQTLVRELEAGLAEAWRRLGLTVVAVELFSAEISHVRAYQALRIATVDNIDRGAGQIALPFALAGESADYGMKPSAERLLPRSLDGASPASPAPNP